MTTPYNLRAATNATSFAEDGALNVPPMMTTLVAPATGLTLWWYATAGSGFKFNAHLSELQVFNLTRMGLDGLLS